MLFSKNKKKQILLLNILVLFVFILDRILKKIAILGIVKKIYFFDFSLFINPNIAFSLPLKGVFFYLLLIIIFIILLFNLIKSYNQARILSILSLSLIIVGGLSNVLDRFQYNGVIDYISVWIFPIFNISDLMISCGVIILITQYIKPKIKH